MKINEIIGRQMQDIAPAPIPKNVGVAQARTPAQQAVTLPVKPTATKRGEWIRQKSVDIAQNNATYQPTSDDIAMAMMRSAEVQRDADKNLVQQMSKNRLRR